MSVSERLIAMTGVVGALLRRQPHGVPGLLSEGLRPITGKHGRPFDPERVGTSIFVFDERTTIARRRAEPP